MKSVDWAVLSVTLAFIVAYGLWRTRSIRTVESYLRGGSDTKWITIGLAVMATQASAITFLSTPGQAYQDGMGFIQFYFGLPLAIVLLSATILPLYYRLRVFTAYEYLESRFDLKTRLLTAFIFLLQRGLGAGISIYAPAIILSAVLGWPLRLTVLAIGVLVVIYTVSGGTRAVNQTQTLQMTIMLGGMALAAVLILLQLPAGVSFREASGIAGALGKLKVVDYSVRLDARYTFWSGILGGVFLQLAYFGTDQSQVQRYLSGESLTQSRIGLLFNALVKIPMQFLVLFVGVTVFVFYQFHPPPISFNRSELAALRNEPLAQRHLQDYEEEFAGAFREKESAIAAFLQAKRSGVDESSARRRLQWAEGKMNDIRNGLRQLIKTTRPNADATDADYIFIRFITEHLPPGVVGLLIAVIFCAAMSATAAALNALGTTTVVDFYRRILNQNGTDGQYLFWAKAFTAAWGITAVLFATFAPQLANLIQAVNIVGSLFYGPMLGVFAVGFLLKRVTGTAVFWSAIIAQLLVLFLAYTYESQVAFLWFNPIGCLAVIFFSCLSLLASSTRPHPAPPVAG